MDEIQGQVSELVEHWTKAYDVAEASPKLWQPYLKGITLTILNESVETVRRSISRVRTPNGFFPVFQLAKQLAATSLSGLIQVSQQLEAGQYQQLPNFASGIVTLLGAIHTMTVFAAKDASDVTVAGLTAQVSETLAVLGTAQRELEGKLGQLQAADALGKQIGETHAAVKQLEEDAKQALEQCQADRESAAEAASDAKESFGEVNKVKGTLEELAISSQATDEKLKSLLGELTELQRKSAAQQEIIDSILPRGASAGLAAAFAKRGANLDPTKRMWTGIFFFTLLALGVFAYYLSTLKPPADTSYWHFALYRVALAGPLVWLGWFAAIQYGNTIRIQEDYAFKQATSVAFQGYRDHMQYLAQVDAGDGVDAMNLLALRTIEILAREPLRIYGRAHHDASPLQTIMQLAQSIRGTGSDKTSP